MSISQRGSANKFLKKTSKRKKKVSWLESGWHSPSNHERVVPHNPRFLERGGKRGRNGVGTIQRHKTSDVSKRQQKGRRRKEDAVLKGKRLCI